MNTFATFMMSGMKQLQASNMQMFRQFAPASMLADRQMPQEQLRDIVDEVPRTRHHPCHRQAAVAPDDGLLCRPLAYSFRVERQKLEGKEDVGAAAALDDGRRISSPAGSTSV